MSSRPSPFPFDRLSILNQGSHYGGDLPMAGRLHGELKGGTSKETAQELPEGYTKAAKMVAEEQAALAGYRLAEEIEKWVR